MGEFSPRNTRLINTEGSTMRLPLWFTQAFLAMLMVQVGIAFVTGTSPVIGLVGIILLSSSIVVRQFVGKAK
jgi:hypothetical protein